MSRSLTASYKAGSSFELGTYREKEPMYQDRYKEFEVIAIKAHQTCIINKRGTMEIVHTGFLKDFDFIEEGSDDLK